MIFSAKSTFLLALFGVLVVGCGIPADEQPRTISDTIIGAEASENLTDSGQANVYLFYVNNEDELRARESQLPEDATLNDLLDRLTSSPPVFELPPDSNQTDQTNLELSTKLPEGLEPRSGKYDTRTGNQTVLVSEDANLEDMDAQRLQTVFSQIVCSLTNQDFDFGISSVSIVESDTNRPIYSQNSKGTFQEAPSTSADYECSEVEPVKDPSEPPARLTKRAIELTEDDQT